jgi:hypothetical protein
MKKRTLQIDEDIVFQRREWIAQRVGIVVLSVFVLAALFGLTGAGGPLSHGEAGDRNGGVYVEYERIVRRGTIATLRLHLASSASSGARFWVSAPYLERVRIEAIVPQPALESIENGRHVYSISGGASRLDITLEIEHKTVGRVAGEVGLLGGPSIRFTQWSMF